MSKIADRKLDQHTCEKGQGRLSVEKWSSYPPAGTFGAPTEVDWWLVEGIELGSRRIFFCPYCGAELTK
jgi:hypothetical protein